MRLGFSQYRVESDVHLLNFYRKIICRYLAFCSIVDRGLERQQGRADSKGNMTERSSLIKRETKEKVRISKGTEVEGYRTRELY